MAEPIDTDALREAVCLRSDGVAHATIILCDEVDRLRVRRLAAEREVWNLRAVFTRTKVHLCDEVDRLRAENTALAAALEDIAGITYSPAHEVYVNGECSRFQDPPCHEAEPTDPEDWCITCVAEVAWSAWKMGVLGG